jgi:hypothetical protein
MVNWALSFSQNGDKCFFWLARVSFFCAAFILHFSFCVVENLHWNVYCIFIHKSHN